MVHLTEKESFLGELERVSLVRREVANCLQTIADKMSQLCIAQQKISDFPSLVKQIESLTLASNNFRNGVFRLLILGEKKRGKSTVLNVLLGEDLLPTDVTPCTAVITVLRFGQEKKVVIHFNDERPSEELYFDTFKRDYTIDPKTARQLEETGQSAFPFVEYAEVFYPLTLLEKGVEIVDSPGLNDTESRNKTTLNYIKNCHAVLFILSAVNLCNQTEMIYLDDYILGRNISIFFLINFWDEISRRLTNPNNEEELLITKQRVREYAQSNLEPYCSINGQNLYSQRVFEISALNALRLSLQQPPAPLDGTGFVELMRVLRYFLTQERAEVELQQARMIAQTAYSFVFNFVENRIPLIEESSADLRQRIASVQPEFEQLKEIRVQFQSKIEQVKQEQSQSISLSFAKYLIKLGDTFEKDFEKYQPNITNLMDFIRRDRRNEFENALKQAFVKYISDQVSQWSLQAEIQLKEAFEYLGSEATNYGISYAQITEKISEKVAGKPLIPNPEIESIDKLDKQPAWAKWGALAGAVLLGNYAGAWLAYEGIYDLESVTLNIAAILAVNVALIITFGTTLGPLGMMLAGAGFGALQAYRAKQILITELKKNFVECLPQIAQKEKESVRTFVVTYFNKYEKSVIGQINNDIKTRQAELNSLSEQHSLEKDQQRAEINRLRSLHKEIYTQWTELETIYNCLKILEQNL